MLDAVSQIAAFFDLDKTIIAKSSVLAFGKPFYQGGLINRRAVLRSAYAQFVFALAGADHDQIERMRAYLTEHVHRVGRRTGARDRLRDAARHHRSDRLRRGGRADRTCTRRPAATWSSSAVRCEEVVAPIGDMLGRRRGHRHRRWSSRTASTPARSTATPTDRRRRWPCASSPNARLRPRRLLCVFRLGHRRADARGGRPPVRGQSPTGPAQGRGRARLAGADVLQRRAAARAAGGPAPEHTPSGHAWSARGRGGRGWSGTPRYAAPA